MAGVRHDARQGQAHDFGWGSREARDAPAGGTVYAARRYARDSGSASGYRARLVTYGRSMLRLYFSSLTPASLQPTSFRSNRIANRRRSTRGAPPRAGTYWNIARTDALASLPRAANCSTLNFAVIWFQPRKNASQPFRSCSVM